MLTLFIASILISLSVSFFCSLAEASLLSISMATARHLADTNSRSGKLLLRFKTDINKPISAILTLNTLAHTAGAAIAGSCASALWGNDGLMIVSIVFSLGVLIFSEIIPKILGVTYGKFLVPIIVWPVKWTISLLLPVVYLLELISQKLGGEADVKISEEEVISVAQLGVEHGSIDDFENQIIKNAVKLNELLVKDIQTPRVKIFALSLDTLVSDVKNDINNWKFSRIPLYTPEDRDNLTHYVLKLDIYKAILNGDEHKKLIELARKLHVFPELTTAGRILTFFLKHNEHIAALIDEYGALSGIITLEDILEEIVGEEIIDEVDKTQFID